MPDIIVLECVYDNSDIRTDYFNRDKPLWEWYVCPLVGKVVTESKLRRAVRLLPYWLQRYNWKYRKGEKFSMSDHPYGQLRVDEGVGVNIPNSHGNRSSLRFVLGVTFGELWKSNYDINEEIPSSFDEFRSYVEQREKRREERLQRMREKYDLPEKKKQEQKVEVVEVVAHRFLFYVV